MTFYVLVTKQRFRLIRNGSTVTRSHVAPLPLGMDADIYRPLCLDGNHCILLQNLCSPLILALKQRYPFVKVVHLSILSVSPIQPRLRRVFPVIYTPNNFCFDFCEESRVSNRNHYVVIIAQPQTANTLSLAHRSGGWNGFRVRRSEETIRVQSAKHL